MSLIHSTSIIDPKAEIHPSVTVGPFCIVGEDVTVGENTIIGPYTRIQGKTSIGSGNKFSGWSAIGCDPQDINYKGEPTELTIGNNNIFREFQTMSRGSKYTNLTTIGSNNLFMAYCHVAHDCRVGSFNTFANSANFAGHVEIGDHITVGGVVAVHQFCHIGSYSMVGAKSKVAEDVLPFAMTDGVPLSCMGINARGLARNNFSTERILAIRRIFKLLYYSKKLKEERMAALAEMAQTNPDAALLLDFYKNSKRGVVPRRHG